ncbi:MAG: hypothetical protein MZU97_14795 [Bacillus subtilis]|nr:hypothetical protein [Bacillus subtilis]
MKTIDLSRWNRRKHYELFKTYQATVFQRLFRRRPHGVLAARQGGRAAVLPRLRPRRHEGGEPDRSPQAADPRQTKSSCMMRSIRRSRR